MDPLNHRAGYVDGSSIQRGPCRLATGNFENWELWKRDLLRFGNQILVAVLVTLQYFVILVSRNAVKNCIFGEKWGGGHACIKFSHLFRFHQ